jgi:hypothetical protein
MVSLHFGGFRISELGEQSSIRASVVNRPKGESRTAQGRLRCATARPHFRFSGRDVGFVELGLQPWEDVFVYPR